VSDAFVPDASTAIAWVHPGQASVESDALLFRVEKGAELVVPGLWFVEVANALLVLERRRRIGRSDRGEALERLQQLNPTLDVDGPRMAFSRSSEIAASLGLSVYDATYLELAERRRIALATLDRKLRAVARKAGITVVP
jgi:predicted nucleic acid-binding protein